MTSHVEREVQFILISMCDLRDIYALFMQYSVFLMHSIIHVHVCIGLHGGIFVTRKLQGIIA